MNAAREDVCRRSVAERDAAREKRLRVLLGLVLAAAFALPGTSALAQSNPFMPKMSIGGEQKRPLTPEEAERQKQIDADYKASISKIPTLKAADPWADMRQGPAASGPKASASTQKASTQKKKQSAQQPQ
jgi:hypothetical protein